MTLHWDPQHTIVKVTTMGPDLSGNYYAKVRCSCGKVAMDEDNAILDWMQDHLWVDPNQGQS